MPLIVDALHTRIVALGQLNQALIEIVLAQNSKCRFSFLKNKIRARVDIELFPDSPDGPGTSRGLLGRIPGAIGKRQIGLAALASY
jgi:hypothetical protein